MDKLIDNSIKEAVERLRKVLKENKDWNFMYAASKVAEWHKIDISLLLSAYSTGKKRRLVQKKVNKISLIERDEDGYPKGTPWYVRM